MNFQRAWKSPERNDRMEEDHERARQASKMLVNVGSIPFTRDNQNIPRDRLVFKKPKKKKKSKLKNKSENNE